MKASRLHRLVMLIGMLQGGRTHNTSELARHCGVSRRTIFRDIDMLKQAGIPLVFDDERQRYSVPVEQALPPTNFTAEEALAMLALCYDLGDQDGIPFYAPARTAALKLESCLPAELRDHLRSVTDAIDIRLEPTTHSDVGQQFYRRLVDAVSARRAVRIEYDSLTEWRRISTKLHPYRLLFSRRGWYVIGRSSLHRGTRTFKVSRILALTDLDEKYRIPRGFSLARYLRNAWHMIPEPGSDCDVLIRFQPMVAQNVAEVQWHKTQHTQFNEDGTLDFRVTVSGLGEIFWWVLGYGDQAEVIEPPQLREMVAHSCARMMRCYDDSPGDNADGSPS